MSTTVRKVRLFRNNRNQAVRIPKDFELPGEEAVLRKEGDKLVLEPASATSLLGFLKTLPPLDIEFPEVDDPLPENIDL